MDDFVVYPAIDLRAGKVVRLRQGDATRQTTYGADALDVARRWRDAGATWLHVVNLDGALGEADTQNMTALRSILTAGVCVQFGGGLRSMQDVARVLRLGVLRVVIGTLAVEEPQMLSEVIARFGSERVAVAVDARGRDVRVRGWTQDGGIDVLTLCAQLKASDVTTVVLTDIARDGMRVGVDLSLARQVAHECRLRVIASGGVASVGDVRRVREAGLSGVIVGRALYEGHIDLREALAC